MLPAHLARGNLVMVGIDLGTTNSLVAVWRDGWCAVDSCVPRGWNLFGTHPSTGSSV
jgi:hypothetical protein